MTGAADKVEAAEAAGAVGATAPGGDGRPGGLGALGGTGCACNTKAPDSIAFMGVPPPFCPRDQHVCLFARLLVSLFVGLLV